MYANVTLAAVYESWQTFARRTMILSAYERDYSEEEFENEEIVVLVSSLHELKRSGIAYVFSDRHAKLETAAFFDDDGKLFRPDPDDLDSCRARVADATRNYRRSHSARIDSARSP